ncbi:MAG: TauD/TfdA family dioxygenase [Rhodospirillaceae bacterium]|nr:TauD/TfdA family dioxygenase [Rhodospirillaceae bacterium]MDD9915003.1 TauD/TfdA family dioxygenase [Rhodospirillaceae bacterium]MDD9927315.1 TauD/TfdA family dioxygenase [Rhodospirillaceae bacterium]
MQTASSLTSATDLEERFAATFGPNVQVEQPLGPSGMGARVTGVDLSVPLTPAQVELLLDTLSQCRLFSISGQDLDRFSLDGFERFANHWGAPVAHPSNFLRGGKPAQQDGASDGAIEFRPYADRKVAAADSTLPGQVACMPHESPAVLVATNLLGEGDRDKSRLKDGGTWHTDIEYEPLPIYVSMFLVHHVPVARDAANGHWVDRPVASGPEPYFPGSDDDLMALRKNLPLDGETSYADTAAAFAALPADEQARLETVQVRRRLNEGDEGFLAPLVRTDPRSGIKSLHSPVWASRPGVRPPIEVEGMTPEESREFLDRLEKHVLQPQFRYDHLHRPGDVTIWNNYMSLHTSPPIKTGIDRAEDARLLYRLSCKGEPSLTLPRQDNPSWVAANIPGEYSSPTSIVGV